MTSICQILSSKRWQTSWRLLIENKHSLQLEKSWSNIETGGNICCRASCFITKVSDLGLKKTPARGHSCSTFRVDFTPTLTSSPRRVYWYISWVKGGFIFPFTYPSAAVSRWTEGLQVHQESTVCSVLPWLEWNLTNGWKKEGRMKVLLSSQAGPELTSTRACAYTQTHMTRYTCLLVATYCKKKKTKKNKCSS